MFFFPRAQLVFIEKRLAEARAGVAEFKDTEIEQDGQVAF